MTTPVANNPSTTQVSPPAAQSVTVAAPKVTTNAKAGLEIATAQAMTIRLPGLPGVAPTEEMQVVGLSPMGQRQLNKWRPLARFAAFVNSLPREKVPAVAIGSLVTVAGVLTLATPLGWGASLIAGGLGLLGAVGILRAVDLFAKAEQLVKANTPPSA